MISYISYVSKNQNIWFLVFLVGQYVCFSLDWRDKVPICLEWKWQGKMTLDSLWGGVKMSQGGVKKNRARFARADFTLCARSAHKVIFCRILPPPGKNPEYAPAYVYVSILYILSIKWIHNNYICIHCTGAVRVERI